MMIPPSPQPKRLQGLLGFVLAFVLVAAASCSSELEGSGEAATEQRTVSVFTRVDIDNGADLTLTVAPSSSGDAQLTITTDSNLIEFLTTRVADGELRVSPDRNGGLSTDLGFDVSGTAPSLESVTVNNGANATITGSVAQVTLAAHNGASIDGEALETSTAIVDVDNGAHITICATGQVTGTTANGAELTVRCGGDANLVEATDGGRVITTP